jgi:integrase
MILLTGQRPGEVSHMRTEHIVDGWWEMPGEPVAKLGWPGTKNGASHRVWLPKAAQNILEELDTEGLVFAGSRGAVITTLDRAMRVICKQLKVERATPHDLRRTHGSSITGLGFGRDAMNRVQNHREGGISDIYDRHEYRDENVRVMESVASRVMSLIDSSGASNVVAFR